MGSTVVMEGTFPHLCGESISNLQECGHRTSAGGVRCQDRDIYGWLR